MHVNTSGNSSRHFEFNDYTQRVIVACMILIISVVGIAGNTMVILAVLLSRKLRTATNAFVVNLSLSDLLTCIVIPCNTVALLGRQDPPINEWACRVVAIVQFTTVGCSIFNLASIAVNRLLLITRPNTTYRRVYTPGKIAAWLVLNWLIPLLVSLTPPLVHVGAVGYNKQFHLCGSIASHPSYFTYNVIIETTLYPLPLLTIIISYTLIWMHLRRHSKRLTKTPYQKPDKYTPRGVFTVSDSADNLATVEPAATTAGLSGPPARNRQTEVTKNMLYVVCGFGICLTPYAINLVFYAEGPGIPYTTAILLFNNCINPFIYATKHRDFKAVFGCILRRQWRLIPDPSDFLKALKR